MRSERHRSSAEVTYRSQRARASSAVKLPELPSRIDDGKLLKSFMVIPPLGPISISLGEKPGGPISVVWFPATRALNTKSGHLRLSSVSICDLRASSVIPTSLQCAMLPAG